MTKKKKIIIISVCLSVVLISTIIGIIIATWKRFNISPNFTVEYNNHTTMDVIETPSGLISETTSFYSNGTFFTEDPKTNKLGVYSCIDNKTIAPAEYSHGKIGAISVMDTTGRMIENLFKAIKDNGQLDYYNDSGKRLSITTFNEEENQNYGFIKERKLNVSLKRKGVKVKTSDDFVDEKIAISDAKFDVAYIRDSVYNYEQWTLEDTNGNKFINLYKVSKGDRVLVQTLNNNVGSTVESTLTNEFLSEYPVIFLKDGSPRILQTNIVKDNNDDTGILEILVFDIHFNLEGSAKINIDNNLHTTFRVGNNLYFQYKIPASEKKYEFAETTTNNGVATTNYFNLDTHRLNLKSGNYSEINFNYLVEDYNSEFNVETVLIHARQIKSKLLESPQLILINDKLQHKNIDYEFNYLTKINKDRYIAHGDNGEYLIDKKYNKICFLGNYDNIFTTNESIMLSSNETGYTFVCDMEGTIVRKYLNNEITNIYNDTYYMITTESEEDGVTYTEKYLERLGIRQKTPIHRIKQGETSYEYNNETYVAYSDSILSKGVSIITRVKKEAENDYTYEFYNIEGKLLKSIPHFQTSDRVLTYWSYKDKDNMIVYISTNKAGQAYTMIVNR